MSHVFKIIEPGGADRRVAPPAGGLPPQRLPRFARLMIQILVYPFMRLDLACQALLRMLVRPPHRRLGQCQMSGRCCRYLAQQKSGLHKWPFFHWWATEVNGFYERSFEVEAPEGQQMRIYSCRHLTAEGRCNNYAFRPVVCRTWPRIDYFGQPSLMKGCGYRFEPRKKPTPES